MRHLHFLKDRYGKAYQIDFERSRELWTIRVWDDRLPVAYLWARPVGNSLLRIQDFKVTDDLRAPESELGTLIRRVLQIKPRLISYQRRGIGTSLLSWLVSQSNASGIRRIEGDLAGRDLSQFPGLPGWYLERGFALEQDALGLHISYVARA